MTTQATGTFEIKSWEEQPYDEIDGGAKLARARVIDAFHGDIEGEGTAECLIAYGADGSACFAQVERVVGRLGDRAGSFVLQVSGTYAGQTAKGTWFVVPGAGTEELRGLRGEGVFVAHHGPHPIEWAGRAWEPLPMGHASMTLDYDVD